MIREKYAADDFDFAVLFIEELDVFYILPSQVFLNYGSEIHLIETEKRQRKPVSSEFRSAWNLIESYGLSR